MLRDLPDTAVIVLVVAVNTPLRVLLGTEPLGVVELLACAAVAVVPGLALRIVTKFGT